MRDFVRSFPTRFGFFIWMWRNSYQQYENSQRSILFISRQISLNASEFEQEKQFSSSICMYMNDHHQNIDLIICFSRYIFPYHVFFVCECAHNRHFTSILICRVMNGFFSLHFLHMIGNVCSVFEKKKWRKLCIAKFPKHSERMGQSCNTVVVLR